MKLEAVELCRARLRLVEPWVSAHGRIDHRDVLLVHALFDQAEGWGECVALPEPTYSAEYTAGALAILRDHLVPRLLRGGYHYGDEATSGQISDLLAPVKGHQMAKAAVEMALLDAELRADGVALADYLWRRSRTAGSGSDRRPRLVQAGVAVGVPDSIRQLAEEVTRRIDEGYRRVKLKIHPGWDVAPVRAVRDLIGDQFRLQVDANGSYAGMDLAPLHQLDPFGLLLIEQPLGDDDLVGHAALGAAIGTPICLDESISSPDAATSAIALRACSIINVKSGRVGGHRQAVEIHDRGVEAGMPLWCGGMIESGVGRAANLALATLPGFCLPGDLSATSRYWRNDVCEPVELMADGMLAVPEGPGLGIEVNLGALGGDVWRELLR